MKFEEKEAGNQMKMSEDSYSCYRCQQGNGGAQGKCLEEDRTWLWLAHSKQRDFQEMKAENGPFKFSQPACLSPS